MSSKKAQPPSKSASKRPVAESSPAEPADGEPDLKKAFRAKYDVVATTRTIRTGGASLPTVTVEGVVMRYKETRVAGREAGTTVPKMELDIDVHKTRPNNAPDTIDSGEPGFAWLLPTKKPPKAAETHARDVSDDGPEASKSSKGKGTADKEASPPRALCLSENHKTVWLGNMMRVSFYTTTGKGEKKEGVDLVKPGMPIEVTGSVANLSADGQYLYLNASNCTPRLDGIVTGANAEVMHNWLAKPEVLASAAVRLSMCARGFFGVTLKPAQDEQATVFRDKWVKAKEGTIAACEAKAQTIRSELGAEGEAAASVMDNHASRLKGTNPADFAFGAPFFNPVMAVTPDRPAFTASVVHEILDMDLALPKMLSSLLDKEEDGPETFCFPSVSEVEMVGNVLMNVKCRLTFVGSRAKALEQVKAGVDATLDTGAHAALGIKFNMRELPKWTAVLNSAKAYHLCQDVAKYGKWCALVGVTPRELNDEAVVCPFANGFQFDMPPTLQNISVLVDEEFVRAHLCDGDSNYVYQHDPVTPMIQDKEGVNIALGEGVAPTLTYHGYQEISGAAYSFKAKPPPNKPNKQYRIWYEGCTASILDDTELIKESAAGKKAVAAAAAAVGCDLEDFFKQRCAIYVVATA